MSTFSDFIFYRDEFHGRLTEDIYNANVNDAYTEILSQTNGRALTASENMQRSIKICECALVDIIAAYKATTKQLPRGIASVTNDKYSVSVGSDSIIKSELKERKVICTRYLQFPVNLMYRWL